MYTKDIIWHRTGLQEILVEKRNEQTNQSNEFQEKYVRKLWANSHYQMTGACHPWKWISCSLSSRRLGNFTQFRGRYELNVICSARVTKACACHVNVLHRQANSFDKWFSKKSVIIYCLISLKFVRTHLWKCGSRWFVKSKSLSEKSVGLT